MSVVCVRSACSDAATGDGPKFQTLNLLLVSSADAEAHLFRKVEVSHQAGHTI
jgi:hypothetical protein